MKATFYFENKFFKEIAMELLVRATGGWGSVETPSKCQEQMKSGQLLGQIDPEEFWQREPVGLSLPAKINSGTGNTWTLVEGEKDKNLVFLHYEGTRGSFLYNSQVNQWLRPLVESGVVVCDDHESKLPGMGVWDSTNDWILTVSDGLEPKFISYRDEQKTEKELFVTSLNKLVGKALHSRDLSSRNDIDLGDEVNKNLRQALYTAWRMAKAVADSHSALMEGGMAAVQPSGCELRDQMRQEVAVNTAAAASKKQPLEGPVNSLEQLGN